MRARNWQTVVLETRERSNVEAGMPAGTYRPFRVRSCISWSLLVASGNTIREYTKPHESVVGSRERHETPDSSVDGID